MKKIHKCLILVLLSITGSITYAQETSLTIYYSIAEKGRDSNSSSEDINMVGNTVLYSVKYAGRKGSNQTDEKKECIISNDQLNRIRLSIIERKLNVTDSLIDNSASDQTVVITITFRDKNKTSTTRVKGGLASLQDKPLYKNSVFQMELVKGMLKNCH